MKFIGLIAGKIALIFGKILRRGSSLPGMIAMKISPGILKKIKYPSQVIVITGTNGKTTTANLLAEILENSGKKVVHNTRGANMLSGLATAIITRTSIGFRLKADVLLLEVDESTIPKFFKDVEPTHLVVTNFFMDQLDRHGDMGTLINKIKDSVSSNVELILNGNDPLVNQLGEYLKDNKKVYYGLEKLYDSVESEKESEWCPNCNNELKYNYYHYNQIGDYHCQCGFKTPDIKYLATKVDLPNKRFSLDNDEYKLSYDNVYFVFNILGAIAAAKEVGIESSYIKKTVHDFKIGDGRMEDVIINDYSTFLNLVKNPAGLSQTINHILDQNDKNFSLLYAINNTYADGIDTSWIWEVPLEKLDSSGLDKIICSGNRAYDLAVRLKYAGIDEDRIIVLEELEEALVFLKENIKSKPYIISSYSTLQTIRKLIGLSKKGKSIWN